MASPAFIYAFDNLGPEKFYELCGLLLGARHRGFLLSGPGPDGGVDAEVDLVLAEWQPEADDAVDALIVTAQDKVVFQMKHKVVARAGGQARARAQLLASFRRKTGGELSQPLLRAKQPTAYVLVTNVEVNSEFRAEFAATCKAAIPALRHAQIIGLDELASWVGMDAQLRHLYFPTMFGPARFDLRVELTTGKVFPGVSYGTEIRFADGEDFLEVGIMNVGTEIAYVSKIRFKNVVEGKVLYGMQSPFPPGQVDPLANPKLGTPLPPGRRQDYRFYFEFLRTLGEGKDVHLSEVRVQDEVGNWHAALVSDELRRAIWPRD